MVNTVKYAGLHGLSANVFPPVIGVATGSDVTGTQVVKWYPYSSKAELEGGDALNERDRVASYI
jgi:hypothetical protein